MTAKVGFEPSTTLTYPVIPTLGIEACYNYSKSLVYCQFQIKPFFLIGSLGNLGSPRKRSGDLYFSPPGQDTNKSYKHSTTHNSESLTKNTMLANVLVLVTHNCSDVSVLQESND